MRSSSCHGAAASSPPELANGLGHLGGRGEALVGGSGTSSGGSEEVGQAGAAAAASSLGGEVVGNSAEGYFLQLRVGNQTMRIPFDVGLAGKEGQPDATSQDSQDGLSSSWAGNSFASRLTPGLGMGGTHSAASSRGVSPALSTGAKLNKADSSTGSGRKRGAAAAAHSDAGASDADPDEKRRDTLERNK